VILPDGTMVRCDFTEVDIEEFSGVDVPAHESAKMAIAKSATILTTATPKENATMPDLETVSAELKKANESLAAVTVERDAAQKARDAAIGDVATLTKALAMPADHLAYYRALPADEGKAFVAKSAGDRAAAVKAAEDADPIVHTLEDGTPIRKSAGPIAIGLAKENAALKAAGKAAIEAATMSRVSKRAATELGNLGGGDLGSVAVIKALEGMTLTDEEKKAAAQLLKSANDGAAAAFKSRGSSRGGESNGDLSDPDAALEMKVKKYAGEKKVSFAEAYDNLTNPEHPDCDDDALVLYQKSLARSQNA